MFINGNIISVFDILEKLIDKLDAVNVSFSGYTNVYNINKKQDGEVETSAWTRSLKV